ncbi:hypothetical protein TNCV_2456741 [Trichonephila clavipes]|nr:hypothetical protein TNCV_2456741 [Trichonephila clavipes]
MPGSPPRNAIHEHERLCLVHAPLLKPVEYLPFCVRGKLSQKGRGGLMVVKGTKQQKIFLELGVVAMSLETLPEFNAIYDGTFPHSLHEEVHEDVSYCTMTVIRGTIQRWASRRFNRVPSPSKGRTRVGTVQTEGCIVQRMKHKWGKHETRRPQGKKRNGERPSMKRGNSKWGGEMGTAGKLLMREKRNGEMETNQICNECRPSMNWQKAKDELATGQG